MKNHTVPASLTAVALVLSLASSCGKKETAHAPQIQTVDVAEAFTDSVTLFHTYPGVLGASSEAAVVARVNGTLKSVNYHGGDFVRAGQVLFTIEDDNYRDAAARAQAAVASAESQLEYATNHYAALQRALESDAVSRMEVQQGQNAVETAQASLNSARADLNTALTSLGYCTVRAPFDGHVSTNIYSVGSYIAGAASPVTLANIYDDSRMNAKFAIEDQAYLDVIRNQIEAGAVDYEHIPISFTDTLPHSYVGRLNYMAPSLNPSTGTMNIEAVVENPYNELRSGMYTSVDLPVGSNPRAILIKDAAISSDQRGKYVYTVNDSNLVVYTPVVVGQLVRDSLRIVESGLRPGDKYVTKALMRVRPGMPVNPRME